MRRQLPSLALLFLAGAVLAQEPPQDKPAPPPAEAQIETPSFPAQVEMVTVDAVVTDKKGKPVPGLTRDDFTISEDGDLQTIASFEAVELPAAPAAAPPERPRVSTNQSAERNAGRTFAVLFDDIHMSPFQARRAKIAVAEFLKSGTREGDRVALISAGGDAWWSARMEEGRDELIALVKRLDGRRIPDRSPDRMSDYEAMRIHVFGDTQMEQTVSRRYSSYGVNPNTSAAGRVQEDYSSGDPMVRGKAADVYYQAVTRNRITLEVMERILNSLASTTGRKSLILVSEGFIYDPNLDEFKGVVQASRRSNCAVYFVDTRGLGGFPEFASAEFGPAIDVQDLATAFADPMEASAGSESISIDSGGFTVKNTNDLAKGIQRIADESRVYYLLGYHSTNTKADGRFRKIEVKLARKGLEVRARKGYYAPLAEGQVAKKKPETGDPAFQQALDSPYEMSGVPLRMTSYVFEETLLGKARVLVAADVDVRNFSFEEQDGRYNDTLEFLMVTAHRETGEYFRYDQQVAMRLLPATRERLVTSWFPVVREFELAPGGYQAKLVVRDKRSGKIGTVVHEFTVPSLAQFRASTPILGDGVVPGTAGSDAPHVPPTARTSFAPGSPLFCQFEVYGAEKDKATGMPKVSAGYVVRKADGTVIVEAPPSEIRPTSLGKLNRLVGTKLDGATPGDYELVLRLKDELSGKSVELKEPFRVAAAG